MAAILHYCEINGSKEYVVITDSDATDDVIEENRILNFEFDRSYEFDSDTGLLPTDIALFPKY